MLLSYCWWSYFFCSQNSFHVLLIIGLKTMIVLLKVCSIVIKRGLPKKGFFCHQYYYILDYVRLRTYTYKEQYKIKGTIRNDIIITKNTFDFFKIFEAKTDHWLTQKWINNFASKCLLSKESSHGQKSLNVIGLFTESRNHVLLKISTELQRCNCSPRLCICVCNVESESVAIVIIMMIQC